MKSHLFIFPLIAAGIVAYQADAQQTVITSPLDLYSPYSHSNTDIIVSQNGLTSNLAAISVHTGASYTGTNINISATGTNSEASVTGIEVGQGAYINFTTSGEGIWNTINATSGGEAIGIHVGSMASASYISNTQINAISTGNWIANGIFNDSNQTVALDNVNITVNGHDEGGNGLSVYRGGSITNKGNGQVSMTGGGILASMGGGSVDLYNATITVTDDPPTSNTASNGVLGFMTIQKNSSISLTDSKINSLRGNILISEFFGMSASVTTTANLDNVNLDDAKNQIISFYSSTLTVNLSNGTNFDGYSRQLMMGTGSFDINITTGASWNVTQDSTTGQAGSLSLGADSTISFVSTAGADTFANDFTNIHSAATMLAEGSILRLDKNAAAFEEGDIITLFTGASGASFTNNGALMMTADGQQLEYLDLDNGMFQIIGFLIPEPSTTTLGLAALGLLVFRRRVP